MPKPKATSSSLSAFYLFRCPRLSPLHSSLLCIVSRFTFIYTVIDKRSRDVKCWNRVECLVTCVKIRAFSTVSENVPDTLNSVMRYRQSALRHRRKEKKKVKFSSRQQINKNTIRKRLSLAQAISCYRKTVNYYEVEINLYRHDKNY